MVASTRVRRSVRLCVKQLTAVVFIAVVHIATSWRGTCGCVAYAPLRIVYIVTTYYRNHVVWLSHHLHAYARLLSRPAELPRQPLAELHVNLSIHTAPIKQPHLPYLFSNEQIK